METEKKSFFGNLFAKKQPNLDDEQSAKHVLKDLCIYLVFLLVTTIIAMSSREISMFYFNHTIERLFIHRVTISQHADELTFEDLATVLDWWSYVETTFIESLTHFKLNNSNESGFGGNVLLGLPRLRQIRVRSEPCRVDEVFKNEFKMCYGHYSKNKEDIGGFQNSKHYTQDDASTNTVWGLIKRYHGAGYIEMLTFDAERNAEILNKLKDARWVDRATRLILIEFVLFNANVNLFCNVKFLAEIPATGGVLTSNRIQALKYSPLWNEGGFLVPLCSVIFLGLILNYTFQTVREIISTGSAFFFGSVFRILDIVIILVAYISLAYIIWHKFYLNSILDKYAENANQYFSLDLICFWNLFFIDAMGICVFIVWLQIFKYIKFNKTMVQFSITLQKCAKDLLGFCTMFSIVFIAYAYLSVLLFGSVDHDFIDFSTAVLALMRMVLGDFDYEKMETANRVMGPIFFLSFILLVFFILMNMFLAIINDTYSDVKSEITHGIHNQFEEYLKSLLAKLKSCILHAIKKHDGVENKIEEEPKATGSSVQASHSLKRRSTLQQNIPEERKSKTTNEILDSFFEIITSSKHGEEDPLSERVSLLERKLETLIDHLDKVLNKISPSTSNPSSRSL